MRLRVDDAAWRIAVHPGEMDDLAYLGWEVDDLDATIAAVEAAGITVERADVATFQDPFRFRHELVEEIDRGGPSTPGRELTGLITGEQASAMPC